MLTKRDKEILQFINVFGKTYYEVLGVTFFKDKQMARNRITKLMKSQVIGYLKTGLESPRRALTLGSVGKDYVEVELNEYVKVPKISNVTIEHNILEQIAYYHLSKIGKVERTTIATHSKDLHHVPDMIYTTPKGMQVYIEVEITKKSKYRYIDIMKNIIKDKPDKLLYISDTADRAKSIVDSIGYWGNKLTYIDIESFLKNVTETQKISPHVHKDPNERPPQIINQKQEIPKEIITEKKETQDIMEQANKQTSEIILTNEVTQNMKVNVSNNIKDMNDEMIIDNIKSTKYINNIINGILYRLRVAYYGIGLVIIYGGGGYWLWEISNELFKFISIS